MDVTTGYATSSDGTRLLYGVYGDGPIDIVWNQGFVSNFERAMDLFPGQAEFTERLARIGRVIHWDRRGFGGSDRPATLPPIEAQVDDLMAVLDAAGAERPALFGVSEGGPMSIMFAATYPTRVSHLILYGTFARLARDEGYPEGVPEDFFSRVCDHLVRNWGQGSMVDVFTPQFRDDRDIRSRFAAYERQTCSPEQVRTLVELLRHVDVRRVLPAISIPTMVATREGDPITSAGQGSYLARQIPGARWVPLHGADHVPVIGDTDELLGAIEEFLTGHRHEPERDRVLGTVLFTDIVGSTHRAVEVGDQEWARLLTRHHDAVRAELGRFRGREIKSTGDGFLAMFDGPTRAVECARAAMRALQPLDLQIRAGLHTGECEILGDDIGGIAVHIASRIAGLAEPDEVLVSRTVKDLSVGSELTFSDRGTHALRGIPDEWQLYAVGSDA